MRIGIVGCGNIAQVHAWSLGKMDGIEIVGLADCKIERAEEMKRKYEAVNAGIYEDYVRMLVETKPDVLHICTPHYLHVPMALEALKRDISVFMEKPPAITTEEFEKLEQAVVQSKGKIGFCFQNRYNETTKELDRIADSGELGKVLGVRGFVTWRRDEAYYSDDWHGSLKKEGGGVLINQSIHTLDLMLRYLGEPCSVEASMQNHHLKGAIEVEDTMEAWMEFEDGKRACFYATNGYAADAPVILELAFEKGRVTLIDQTIQISLRDGEKETIVVEQEKDGIGKSYWGKGHLACIQDFYNSMHATYSYRNDLKGIKNTLVTTMKIYQSARGNKLK